MPSWKKVILSGSAAALSSITVTNNVTATSFTGSLFGTASNAATSSKVSGGVNTYIPLWVSNNQLSTSSIAQSGSTIAINATSSIDPLGPEALVVVAKSGSESYNLISGYTNVDDYAQLNIKNRSDGTDASSDIVATADNGTESTYYINMGINSSNHIDTGIAVGSANDGYLYTTGSDFYIGNATPDKKIIIFNGGLNALANARIFIDPSGTLGVNTNDITPGSPESLFVRAINNDTFNLITAKADVDTYTQINIMNESTGTTASADIVATADNGDETINYIDMGINGSNYSGTVGNPNDGYVYTTGNHLHLGAATPGQYVGIFAGGLDSDEFGKLEIHSDNNHRLTGSLHVTGSLKVSGSVINQMTSSYAMTASFALNAGGSNFTEITTNQTLVLGTNYITNNATKLVLTLPTGTDYKPIRVASKLGGWQINAPSGWNINIIDEQSTSIESNLVTDTVELVPIGGDLYSVLDINGNITF